MQQLRTVGDYDYFGQVLDPESADLAEALSWEDPAGQYELIHLREFEGEGVLLLEYLPAEPDQEPPNAKVTPIIYVSYTLFSRAAAGDLCAQLFRQYQERILAQDLPNASPQGSPIPFRPRPKTT